jgi:hypothetical protein
LLEHLGIRTALIDIPKHLLLMFDTGIHESRRLQLCLPEDQYVIYDQNVWLPVETTMYGESFWQASRKGVEQYDLFDKKNNLVIVRGAKGVARIPANAPCLRNEPFNTAQRSLRQYGLRP